MSQPFIAFHNVSFSYDASSAPLFQDLSFRLPSGWTGLVGPNGAGKTTLLHLAARLLEPVGGAIQSAAPAAYCPQRTDNPPARFAEFAASPDGAARALQGRLGVAADWHQRWHTLSHGERKRAQIAVALWQQPAVLAIDEPTNHIDHEARQLLTEVLSGFDGVGLLVSHDRQLLDRLCLRCIFLDPPRAILRPGNYTAGREQSEREAVTAARARQQAKRDCRKLEREATRRRGEASQADRKRSKRRLSRKDHDAKEKIDRARITGKDAAAGKKLRQLQGRVQQAQDHLDQTRTPKTYELGIWLPGSCSPRNVLFAFPGGLLPLGAGRTLAFPDLAMLPSDRIALTGPNGAGKSTLIRHIAAHLNVDPEHTVYLPQEIAAPQARTIIDDVRSLPHNALGHLMTVVSRLGSRPQRLLESELPSPGEVRKLMLALGVVRLPHLIILDEPTNHLDLPSIECLEQALTDCPCGLLLVSHDQAFLQRLTTIQWHIQPAPEGAQLQKGAP